jgi:hypothetical protein
MGPAVVLDESTMTPHCAGQDRVVALGQKRHGHCLERSWISQDHLTQSTALVSTSNVNGRPVATPVLANSRVGVANDFGLEMMNTKVFVRCFRRSVESGGCCRLRCDRESAPKNYLLLLNPWKNRIAAVGGMRRFNTGLQADPLLPRTG